MWRRTRATRGDSDPPPISSAAARSLWGKEGTPERLSFRRPAAEYHRQRLAAAERGRSLRHGDSQAEFAAVWQARVAATWGLLARSHESLPYLLSMLQTKDPDLREDAAFLLGIIGSDDATVDALSASLESASSHEERDSAIMGLGGTRNRRAIPVLARIILDEQADGDTCWTAAEALGQVVRRRFGRRPDTSPIDDARAWLAAHPQEGLVTE